MSFSSLVLDLVKTIPSGKITTYQQIARKLGSPHSSRAVGNALNKNNKLVIIPCHRVVKSDHTVGGYKAGKLKKISLLQREGINIEKGKINNFEQILYGF